MLDLRKDNRRTIVTSVDLKSDRCSSFRIQVLNQLLQEPKIHQLKNTTLN